MKLTFVIVFFALLRPILHAQPTISFTFDDGVTNDMPGYPFEEWNQMILDHLDSAGVKAILFAMGHNKLDAKGKYLLKSWNDAGHKIGNHTFSHPNYSHAKTTFEKFRYELLMTDTLINRYGNYVRMFRFPYLKEGNTREKVAQFRKFMKDQKYRNGHVTIDASDWYVDSRLRSRLNENSAADINSFREFYISHLLDRAQYYEDLALKLTGRHIRHTILLHHNLASALFLGNLITMFKSNGWNVVDADYAFNDPIFESEPSNIPAGESLIWALAKESGKFEGILRYPAEDGEYEKEKMDKLGL
jgi:peptidoglycan/xylan/chitin deacetylase (PgdA/CDA1 family)